MPILYEIHPSIGIARLGKSEKYFLAPGPGILRPTSYREQINGKPLLKQAAQFQIFRCERDDEGRIVGTPTLLTPAEADVLWTVEVGNRKATARRLNQPDDGT